MFNEIVPNRFEHYTFCEFCRKHLFIRKKEIENAKKSFKRRLRRKWHQEIRYLVTHKDYDD